MLSISRIVITMILTRVTDGSSILRGQFVGRNTRYSKSARFEVSTKMPN